MSRSTKLPGGLFFSSGPGVGKFVKRRWNRKARYADTVVDGAHYKKFARSTLLLDRYPPYGPYTHWGKEDSRK